MKNVINFKYKNGKKEIFPSHYFVDNWLFEEGEEDEAILAHQLSKIAEKNGMSANDMSHLFPYILRMLKSNIAWSDYTHK